MSKAVELLEKNVQYITLGLGGVFVLFMGYRYIYQSPSRELDGSTFSAGQLDPHVAERFVPELEGKMNASGRPEIALPTFVGPFRDAFAGPTTNPVTPGWTLARGLTIDLPTSDGGPGGAPVRPSGSPDAPGNPGAVVVKVAPTLPAGIPIGTSTGLSTVNLGSLVAAATAGQGVVPGAFPGGFPGEPGFEFGSGGPGENPGAGGPPAPGAPRVPSGRRGQPAAGGPAALANPGHSDRAWVTAAFEIPVDEIAKEFEASDVPAGLQSSFLRVEVQREELQSDGSWSGATMVRPLVGSPLAANPLPPAPNAAAEANYRAWAEANQTEILHPGFYSVVGGALWNMPGQATNVVAGAAFDPLKYLTGPIPAEFSKEERDAVLRARAAEASKKAAEERQKRIEQNRNRPPPGGGFPGGPPGFGGGGRGGGPGGGGGRGGGGGGFAFPTPPKISMAVPPGNALPGVEFPGGILPGGALAGGGLAGSGLAEGGVLPTVARGAGAGLMGESAGTGGLVAPWPGFEGFGPGENQWRLMVQSGGPPPGVGPPSQRPPGYPPNLPWPPGGFGLPRSPGAIAPDEGDGQGQPPAAVEPVGPNLGTIPQGPFDPAMWQGGNIITFQHDDTVSPGKSYRYRMRYLMLNPVYGQPAGAADAKIAAQFRWESAWSDWTGVVNVSSKLSFFVSSQITTGANAVQMEIFQFINGRMSSKTFAVQPGDEIGGTDANAREFKTGYALVDIRRDAAKNENYALIMAPDGNLLRRDFSDKSSQRYQDLRKQVSAPAPVGAAGN